MPPVNLGHIFATLGLDTTQLNKGAQEAKGSLNQLDGTMSGVGRRLGQLGVAAAVAGVALVAGLVKTGMSAISAQQDLANSLDVSIDGLRALQIAAKEAGVSNETLAKGITMMNARLGEAQRGTGNAKQALDALGFSAEALAEMDIDDRMAAIADKVRELGLTSAQTADFLRQFGIRGGEMVELFRQGGDAIRDAAGDVKAFGISLSAIDAKMVDNAEESIQRMGLSLEGIRNKVTIALAPVLGVLADRFNEASKASGGFGNIAVDALMKVARVLAWVGNAVRGLNIAFTGVKVVIVGLGLAFNEIGRAAVLMFTKIANTGIAAVNKVIDGINLLGGDLDRIAKIDISASMAGFDESGEAARNVIKTLMSDMKALAMEKLPTEALDDFIADVERKAREIAASQVEKRGEGGAGGFDAGNEETEKRKLALAQQLDAVREYGMDEYELLNKQLQDRMNLIREASALRVIEEADAQELIRDLALKFAEEEKAITDEKMQRIADMSEARRAAAEEEYERSRAFALSDEAAEIEEYERAAARVMKAIDDEIVSKEEGYARLEEMTRAHEERMFSIRSQGLDNVQKFVEAMRARDFKGASRYFADMTANLAQHSKTMFEINKVAGISNAIISAYEGISLTLAKYPYPLSAAMAAAQAALAFTQVKSIASQSFGKSGAAPSLAGSTPAPPVTPVSGGTAAGGGQLFVEGIDPGAIFSGRQLRDLAERLLEYQRDGGTVVFG